jgi:hypothetical protein
MLAAQLKKLGRRTPDPAYRRVVGAAGVAVLSTLVSGAVSEPTISSPDFFLLVGMLVAAAASAPQQAVSSVRQPRYTLKVVSEG